MFWCPIRVYHQVAPLPETIPPKTKLFSCNGQCFKLIKYNDVNINQRFGILEDAQNLCDNLFIPQHLIYRDKNAQFLTASTLIL